MWKGDGKRKVEKRRNVEEWRKIGKIESQCRNEIYLKKKRMMEEKKKTKTKYGQRHQNKRDDRRYIDG